MDEKRELFGFRLCYGTVDQGDYISKEYSPGYCERFWASVRVTENIKEAFGNGDTPLGAIHDAANKWRDKYSPAAPPPAAPEQDDRLAAIRANLREADQIADLSGGWWSTETMDVAYLLDLVDRQAARIRALEAERNRYLYEMVASQESLLETEHEVVGLYAERDALAARLAAARKALSRSVFPHDSYEVLFSQCVQMIKDALAALDAPA